MISRLRAWLAGFVRRHIVDDEPTSPLTWKSDRWSITVPYSNTMIWRTHRREWEHGTYIEASNDAQAAHYLALLAAPSGERTR